jgi:hypothetical protein
VIPTPSMMKTVVSMCFRDSTDRQRRNALSCLVERSADQRGRADLSCVNLLAGFDLEPRVDSSHCGRLSWGWFCMPLKSEKPS